MNELDLAVKSYADNGYVKIDGIVPLELFREYEEGLYSCVRMQALKVGLDTPRTYSKENLNALVVALNKHDSYALSDAFVIVRHTAAGMKLASCDQILSVCAALLDCPDELMVVSGPSVFANIPSHKTRLYTWHAEAVWYPKRRNFVNIWLPVSEPKRDGNGTMSVLEGSHRERWMYFAEYYGFDRETEGNRDLNLQYEIPETELQGYRRVEIEADPGDLVAFAPQCVHRSNLNQSSQPSYALTVRVFDYRRDLTVAASWAERSYRDADIVRSGGRFGLVPADM